MMATFLDDLLNATPSGAREVVRARLRVAVSEALLLAMEAAGLTKAALAAKTGVSRSAITQALSGNRNLSLNALADLAQELNLEPKLVLRRIREEGSASQIRIAHGEPHTPVRLVGQDTVTASAWSGQVLSEPWRLLEPNSSFVETTAGIAPESVQ